MGTTSLPVVAGLGVGKRRASHLEDGDCGGGEAATSCIADLQSTGAPGAILVENRPGPGGWMGDELIILRGDGTAVRQTRSRACPDGESFCDMDAIAWELDEPELCTVQYALPDCPACPAVPVLQGCAPFEEDWTCTEASAAVAVEPRPTACHEYVLPYTVEGSACIGDAECVYGDIDCEWTIRCEGGAWTSEGVACTGEQFP